MTAAGTLPRHWESADVECYGSEMPPGQVPSNDNNDDENAET
jgi:hypothetical protein